jgi:hypothetical protein
VLAVSAGIAAALLLAVGAGPSVRAEQAAGRCRWHIDPHRVRAALYGLAAVSSRNVWAVGYTESGERFALHWLGTGWKSVDVPERNPGELWAVAFATARDGWAVGGGAPAEAIYRWDGSRWIIVPSADTEKPRVVFWDVAVLGRRNAWAVGLSAPSSTGGPGRSLVEHWNGVRWEVASTPDVGQSQFNAVAPISPNDVWAVGNHLNDTLIEHWDGKRWKVIPNPAAPHGALIDIAALSARDIWAVGATGSDQNPKPLLEHWDGAKWRRIAAPVRRGSLESVAALSSRDIWVSGGSIPGGPIVQRRLGTKWHNTRPPHLKQQYTLLIAAAGKNDIWATGEVETTADPNWAIEHFRC